MSMARISLYVAIAASVLGACGAPLPTGLQGYAEGEYVLVAAPFAGSLEILGVQRGQQVEAGAPLFSLEQVNELAARSEAQDRLRASRARVEDLEKGLRTPQLEALRAEADQARAALQLSSAQAERDRKLYAQGFIASSALDQSRANLQRDQARVEQARAQIRLAQQSVGRAGELAAARAETDAANAILSQVQWKLEQRGQRAPVAALVHDTFFVRGEWVPAGKPVVSLLPPGNIKVRFFIPEPMVGRLKIGQAVAVSCDGCGVPMTAIISYVSPQAEFTPPVIYSKDSRAKLVFMVEARPAIGDAPRLKPGQPVTVTP